MDSAEARSLREHERRIAELERSLAQLRTRGSGVSSGTAFPSSPQTGYRFFRSDLGYECFYDGSQWLTCQVFEARMMALTATVTGENNAAGTQIVPHLTDYGLYLLRWEVIAFVLTTNSGANYWTMRLRGAGATTLASTDSSAQAPGVAWRATITSFSNHAAYDYYNVRTEITAGAPGSLTWRWAARYRLIIT
jgi:hypothetical protein